MLRSDATWPSAASRRLGAFTVCPFLVSPAPHFLEHVAEQRPLTERVVERDVRVRRSSNHLLGIRRFVDSRYGVPSSGIANVLMSSAERENGLSPAKRIRYQYTNKKS